MLAASKKYCGFSGWQNRPQSAEDMTLPFSLPKLYRNELEDDLISEDDFRFINEITVSESVVGDNEKSLLTHDCDLVTLMTVVKGKLEITTTHILFFDLSPVKDEIERQDFKFPLPYLREVFPRQYNLRRSALEFFLIDQTNFFVNFTPKIRSEVLKCIYRLQPPNLVYLRNKSPADRLKSGLTQRWMMREISNFEYLMHLNTLAGRTYNDLSQYPVFPWILADYTSDVLDVNDPRSFRDLSKPIGVVNPRNEAEVRAKYESFEDPSGTIAKFHYGTHYSNSAGVLHYLVRVEPFTTLHIELQSGRFDVADRQFHSIPQTWKLLMENPNDVKELIPEFFYFPEFLKNINDFDLGQLQGSKQRVHDVILPPWADSPEDFIYKHRKALESEYVSSNLHHWIDLIFGYKQKGPAAVEALNVFYYCSYEGAVDLDAIKDPNERLAVEGMINNFGQTPRQLLKEPHPQRLSWEEAVAKMIKLERRLDMTLFLDNLRSYIIEVGSDKDPIVYLSPPRAPPKGGFLPVDYTDTLVSITKTGTVSAHSWLPFDRHSAKSFVFEIDPTMNNPKSRKKLGYTFHPNIPANSQMFAVSLDGKFIFCGGNWDYSLQLYSTLKSKVVASIVRHTGIITCVALDNTGSTLVSGSMDKTCIVWDVNHICVLNFPSGQQPIPRLRHLLCGHDAPISCVAIMVELDIIASGSKDGTVNVYTVEEGIYIRTLYPVESSPDTSVSFLALSTRGHVAFAAFDRGTHSVHVYSINGSHIGSKYVPGQVTGLATAKESLVVADDAGDVTLHKIMGLHPIYDIPLQVPVQCVIVTPGPSQILLPLRDGSIAVLALHN